MKKVRRILSCITAAVAMLSALPALAFSASNVEAEAAESYPKQQFRMAIGDTNRNVNISSTDAGTPATSDKANGESSEKWTLNYISEGVYEIVSVATGHVLTAGSGGYATLDADVDAAGQRWNITAVQQDFEEYDLYYSIVSTSTNLALTFVPETNSFSLESYSGAIYQKYKLNLNGLEGFAGNAMTSGGEKAGTIGGLLGDTVYVDTVEECIEAMKQTVPLTIVITENLEFNGWAQENQKIEDDKTIIGSYKANVVYNTRWRNDDFYGDESIAPSNNIVLQNLHFRATELNSSGCGVILVYIYCGRNIWFDHCDFSATFAHNRDAEVGKFIWINTPVANWSDGCYNGISPDYITISYTHFNNRYWTVAYGTQNTDTTRNLTTLMYNKWENCARRTPQIGNGTGHIYNSYHTYSITEPSQQIIAGDGCKMLTERCYFEGLSGLEFAGGGSTSPFRDNGSITAESVGDTASALNSSFDNSHNWNPSAENYGYSLLTAENTKNFCDSYSGSITNGDLKYITDSDMSGWIDVKYDSPFLKDIQCGELATGKEGVILNTANTYSFKNAGSSLYLTVDGEAAVGTDVVQSSKTSDASEWTLKESGNGDGYYYILSKLGDGKTYFLDVANGSPDNGTNIGIWTDTSCDAQLFKFVDNGDGTYQIATKVTNDASGLGIIAGSTEEGVSSVQWKYDGSKNQQWIVEANGRLVSNLNVYDREGVDGWYIDSSVVVGDPVFGDRDVTFTSLPDEVIGSEAIITGCDSKNNTGDLAAFTAAEDVTVYVAFDRRVTSKPSWTAGLVSTGLQAVNSNGVYFDFYSTQLSAGETITLGTNGQSASCVNYVVFVVEKSEETTTTTTTTTTAITTTTTITITTTSETETKPATSASTITETEMTTTKTTVTEIETTTTNTTVTETDPVNSTTVSTTTVTDTTSTETSTTLIEAEVFYGDVNLDGAVSMVDLVMLNRSIAKIVQLNGEQMANADCCSDGKLNAQDASALLQFLVLAINEIPVALV